MARVVVRYFAAARAAAGVAEDVVDADTVSGCLLTIQARHGPELVRVLRVCTLLVDGLAVKDVNRPLGDAIEIDVLPPFAGG
jgi:sulfur-carrier protein